MSRIALSRRAAFVARIESISMFAAGCDAAHCVVTKQVKEGLVKLDRKRCRKKECITIPSSNDSKTFTDCWPVSSCSVVPTKSAKSWTPPLEIVGWIGKRIAK